MEMRFENEETALTGSDLDCRNSGGESDAASGTRASCSKFNPSQLDLVRLFELLRLSGAAVAALI